MTNPFRGTEKRLLITGATGFLGSHLCREFTLDGWKIAALVRPTSNMWRLKWLGIAEHVMLVPCSPAEIQRASRAFDPMVAIHCATDYGRKNRPLSEVIESNIVLPLKLLEHLPPHCCFVNTDTILDKRVNSYSLSKLQFRQWMDSEIGNRIMANVALEHFFGAGDDQSKFCGYLLSNLSSGVPELTFTPGEQRRSFIHVSDVARAFLRIVYALPQTLQPAIASYQIGSPDQIPLRRFCELAAEIAGAPTKLVFGARPYREFEAMDVAVNLSPLTALGWSPLLSITEALRISLDEQRAMESTRPWLTGDIK